MLTWCRVCQTHHEPIDTTSLLRKCLSGLYPQWLETRHDDSGHIGILSLLIWPELHFCPEMDDLLIHPALADWDCFCGHVKREPCVMPWYMSLDEIFK